MPSDFPFSRDGILAEGHPNQEMMIVGDLSLETITQSRESGTVRPLLDSRTTSTSSPPSTRCRCERRRHRPQHDAG
jgi:hypothetical protein